jgi:peptide/nickel transport system permease protein
MLVARRLVRFVVSMVFLLVASFAMIHLVPGDPVRAALGPTAPTSLVDQVRAQLGLNASLLTQFWRYARGVFTASSAPISSPRNRCRRSSGRGC